MVAPRSEADLHNHPHAHPPESSQRRTCERSLGPDVAVGHGTVPRMYRCARDIGRRPVRAGWVGRFRPYSLIMAAPLAYSLVATDLDGTLLRGDDTLSDRSRAALARA